MQLESSITKIDHWLGMKVHILAFGASYVGILKTVDFEKGLLVITDGKDTATIDLERVESFEVLSSM